MAHRPPQTRYAQSSGAKIAYQVSGTGPPDLVVVPGLVSHLDTDWQQIAYRRFVRALEHGGRVIRLDKRGTGLSDPVGELPTLEQRVQDVAAVMAAARSSRAVLFGMSDGGRAAVGFAAAHPGRTAVGYCLDEEPQPATHGCLQRTGRTGPGKVGPRGFIRSTA